MIYGHVRIARLAANIRAARAHAGLSQKSLASRMRALGYKTWSHQAVGNVENNNRPLFAAEILGLALALGVTMSQLMGAPEGNHVVALPSGLALGPVTVRRL